MQEQQWRAGMYQLLAEMLAEPGVDSANYHREGQDHYAAVCRLDGRMAGQEKAWPEPPADLADWQRWYHRSFTLPPKERLVPVESIYRQWTHDETCGLPIAKEKGHLMSDAALHMLKLYAEYGIELPDDLEQQPDHLLLELEFMGMLVEEAEAELQHVFLREHLDWVGELQREAQARKIPQYYQQVLELIGIWLDAERDRLAIYA